MLQRLFNELLLLVIWIALLLLLVPELESALELNDEDFSAKFSVAKPGKDQGIVVSCLKGGRAVRGQGVLKSHGYKDVKVRTVP